MGRGWLLPDVARLLSGTWDAVDSQRKAVPLLDNNACLQCTQEPDCRMVLCACTEQPSMYRAGSTKFLSHHTLPTCPSSQRA